MMTVISRRRFVSGASALAATAASCGYFRRPTQRELVLADLARTIAVVDTRAILVHSEALAAALRSDGAQPTAALIEQGRRAVRNAALAWQHAYAFRNGPIIETHAFIRSAFWPPRQDAIREVLESSDALDSNYVEGLGVDVKGVFALEHLLFEAPKPDAETWFSGPARQRAHAFAIALADDALAYATKAARMLGDGAEFGERFARAGQESINLLVNQMVGTLETAAARRLDHVVGTYANSTLRMKDVHGGPSGLSTEIPRTWLATTQRLYLGAEGRGLSQLVAAATPQIDAELRDAFRRATAAMAKIDAPLEQFVTQNSAAIGEASKAIKELEMALRVDLVSALGVTLTFTASDGD
jgi:predicted lipoprotein